MSGHRAVWLLKALTLLPCSPLQEALPERDEPHPVQRNHTPGTGLLRVPVIGTPPYTAPKKSWHVRMIDTDLGSQRDVSDFVMLNQKGMSGPSPTSPCMHMHLLCPQKWGLCPTLGKFLLSRSTALLVLPATVTLSYQIGSPFHPPPLSRPLPARCSPSASDLPPQRL